MITYSALHSFCQASWYFTGSSCRVADSRSAESIYWQGRGKKQRQNQEFREQTVFGGFAYFYTSEKHKDQSRQHTLTLTSSLWLIERAECSRALITEAYESENFVYFPTRAMEHCSNSLSDLRHKQLRTPYKEMCHDEYWKNPIRKSQK